MGFKPALAGGRRFGNSEEDHACVTEKVPVATAVLTKSAQRTANPGK